MIRIPSNSFAAACYDQNSLADLQKALDDGPDETDMKEWNLTEWEWRAQIELAMAAKREDSYSRNLNHIV